MSAATTSKAEWSPFDGMARTSRRDEFGNPADCCWDSMQAGRTAGWIEGHAAGRQEVLDDLEADAAEAVRGAARRSIDVAAARRRPYTVPRWAS